MNAFRIRPYSRPLHYLVRKSVEQDGIPALHQSEPGPGECGSGARDTIGIEVCGIGKHTIPCKAETMPTEPSSLEGSPLFVVEIARKPALLM